MPGPTNPKPGSLLAHLKQHAASGIATLNVYVEGDDEPKPVAVPDVRKKWERTMNVIRELAWTRVEAVDKKGGLLFVHKRGPHDENAAGDVEDIGFGPASAGRAAEVGQLLAVTSHWLLRAQDVAVARHVEATQQANDMVTRMVESTNARLERFNEQYEETLEMNRRIRDENLQREERAMRVLRKQIEEAGGEQTESGKLLEALAPELIKAILAPAAPAPKPAAAKPMNGKAA